MRKTLGSRTFVGLLALLLLIPAGFAPAFAQGGSPAISGTTTTSNAPTNATPKANATTNATTPSDASAPQSCKTEPCPLPELIVPVLGLPEIWTSINDGAGSGLDADFLDGFSSAFFNNSILNETNARAANDANDTRLRSDLTNETNARAVNDASDTRLRSDLTNETRARSTLNKQFNDYIGTAASIQNQITDEITARQDGDNRLQGEVDDANDQLAALKVNDTEANSNLQRDYSALQKSVNDEASARINKDGALSGRLDGLDGFVNGGAFKGTSATIDGPATINGSATFNGKVGIGTSSPTNRLTITAGSAAPGATIVTAPTAAIFDASGNAGLVVKRTDTGTEGEFISSNGTVILGAASNHSLDLRTNNQARLFIDNIGRVGIGTTTPAAQLQVGDDRGFERLGDGVVQIWYRKSDASPSVQLAQSMPGAPGNGNGAGFVFSDPNISPGASGAAIGVPGTSSPATGNLGFYTTDGSNLAERMRITPLGNVGIGTTSPASKLDIAGGAALGAYAGANAAPANGLIVSGNVGIGTTTPGSKLDVKADASKAIFRGLHSGGGTVVTIDELGRTNVGTLTVVPKLGDTINPIFTVATGGGANAVTATASGNVGIGTSNPMAQFEVGGGVAAFDGTVGIGTTTPSATLEISAGTESSTIPFRINGKFDDGTTSELLRLYHNHGAPALSLGFGGSSSPAIQLDSSSRNSYIDAGNVGIGRRNPTEKLDVSGNVKATRFLAANGGTLGDVAEPVLGTDLQPGDVVVASEFNSAGKLIAAKSQAAYSHDVIGIVSTNPSMVLAGLPTDTPLAVTGIVPVKVVGPVAKGDLLTTSDTPGAAMACKDPLACFGVTIGKALESHAGNETGTVRALVSLG